MEHNVNTQNVQRILGNFTSVINQGHYNTGDLLIAASELLGRIIVDTCDTPVSAVQMATVMEQHIQRCIYAGYTAKGFNMGPIEVN